MVAVWRPVQSRLFTSDLAAAAAADAREVTDRERRSMGCSITGAGRQPEFYGGSVHSPPKVLAPLYVGARIISMAT